MASVTCFGFWYFFTDQMENTEGGRHPFDALKLNVPLFSGLFRKMYMARFSRTAETLLKSGVPMLEVLNICGDAVNNSIVRLEILRGREKVKKW